jgi:hypothetical protein
MKSGVDHRGSVIVTHRSAQRLQHERGEPPPHRLGQITPHRRLGVGLVDVLVASVLARYPRLMRRGHALEALRHDASTNCSPGQEISTVSKPTRPRSCAEPDLPGPFYRADSPLVSFRAPLRASLLAFRASLGASLRASLRPSTLHPALEPPVDHPAMPSNPFPLAPLSTPLTWPPGPLDLEYPTSILSRGISPTPNPSNHFSARRWSSFRPRRCSASSSVGARPRGVGVEWKCRAGTSGPSVPSAPDGDIPM